MITILSLLLMSTLCIVTNYEAKVHPLKPKPPTTPFRNYAKVKVNNYNANRFMEWAKK